MSIAESQFSRTSTAEPTPDDPAVRRWTRDEYYLMGDAGLFEGERVQLIYGEIVKMSPMKTSHAAGVELARRALEKAYGEASWIRIQLPLYITDESEPEPDVAVVPGGPRDFIDEHPRTAQLVVEVSESTLRFDRTIKRTLYVSASIGEYWIVNLIDRRLDVFRAADKGDYTQTVSYTAVDRITPPGAAMPVLVSDLLP